MIRAIKKVAKHIALGGANLSQQCTLGLPDPQTEISVWLCGLGEPLDVTNNHVLACPSPFTVGIGLEDYSDGGRSPRSLSLEFRERNGERRLLADVGLRSSEIVSSASQALSLFHIRSCRNWCLPLPRLLAYDLYQFIRRREDKNPEIYISALASRAMTACFICPRPV